MGKTKTSFKKGQTGNPKGRPPQGYSITETVRSMLGANPQIKQELTQKVIDLAQAGDLVALKLLWNYMDGMPAQGLEIKADVSTKYLIDLGLNDRNNTETTVPTDEQVSAETG